MPSALYLKGSESGAKAQNVEWFATDISPGIRDEKILDFIVQISVSVTAAVVEVTLDSGATWSALNLGTAIPVGKMHQFDVFAKTGDQVNFRATNVSGTTLDILYIVGDLDA